MHNILHFRLLLKIKSFLRLRKHSAKLALPHVCTLCVIMSQVLSRLTALVGPHVKLLGQLRYNQECSPALTFLGFEDISKNMVPDVYYVLSLGPQQVTHNV